MQNKLLKKFLSFSYGSVLGAAISFITTIIATRLLVPEEFGKVSMFDLFVNISMIVAIFGVDQTFVRFFYEEEKEKRGALLYNCLKVSFFIIIPVLIIVFLMRVKILHFLFSEYNFFVFIMLILSVIAQYLFRLSTLVVRMQQKGNIYSLFQILNKVIILVAFLLLYLIIGNSYETMIYSTTIGFLLLSLLLIFTQNPYWNLKNFKITNTKHSKTEIFDYAYPLVFTSAIMWIFRGFDQVALKYWSDFNELGLYAAAFKIIGILAIIQTAFSTFWVPVAYETYQEDPDNTSFFANISKLVSFIMFIVAVLVIMMKDFIINFLGSDYKEASLIIPFLVFIPIMRTISETTVVGINFLKKTNWHIVIVSLSCIFNIFGNWMLVPHYGAIGASISTGISYIVYFSLRTFISLYYYKVDYRLDKFYISTTILFLYSIYTLSSYQPIHEYLIGIIVMFIFLLIYFKDILFIMKHRNV